MKMLDANMILRFLLCDNMDMSNTVKNLIEKYPVIITNEVVAEVVYVLSKVYNLERKKISSALLSFLNIKHINPTEPDVVKTGLNLYSDYNLDFVDCILCAYHIECRYDICTFDKKLLKLIKKFET